NKLTGGYWLLPNTWVHLAGTYDGKTERLYVDGVQVGSLKVSGNIQVTDGVLRIGGNSPWGEYFNGRIDEIRVYDRALTAAEIQSDMGTAIAASALPGTVIGTQTVEPAVDSHPQGMAQSLPNQGGGNRHHDQPVDLPECRLNAGPAYRWLLHRKRWTLRCRAQLGNPKLTPNAGRWNQGTVPAASVRQGWQHSSGVIKFRDLFGSGSGAPETSAQYGLITVSSTCGRLLASIVPGSCRLKGLRADRNQPDFLKATT
ncbi:MAG: LamG domain-containing protein, partial [Gammaproteobacteria bacterium]|nr:LamG domain-containing protein [Gammaproteobacteria bacterium]